MFLIGAVLLELDGMFTFEEEQKKEVKTVLSGQHVSALFLTVFGKSSVKRCGV